MAYDPQLFRHKLDRWQSYMERYRLPSWEELPDMELYMDQVVSLVNRYLDLIPHDEKNPILTPSAVNNYVRLKVMPTPVRKRYNRRHLACLILICSLKQSLSLADIQKILPQEATDQQMCRLYNDFATSMTATTALFIGHVRAAADTALTPEQDYGCESLVLHSAVSSVLYKLLAVKLTRLQDMDVEEAMELEKEAL